MITKIWQKYCPGASFFCISTKSRGGKFKDHFFRREELGSVEDFIDDNRHQNLYFCPHGFSRPRRLKEYAVLPRLLWSDMDEADPQKVSPRPTIAIESSPGRYVGLWVTDEIVSEEINRALSYSIGSDKSGWDLGQVLRIPGTLNYKYSPAAKCKLLWRNGDMIELDTIKVKKGRSDSPTIDSADIWKKYEMAMPAWCRRELMTRRPPAPGKRSEMLWKLNNTLIETGMSRDEAFVLLRASVWNKFAERRNGDDRLRHELDKAIEHHSHQSAIVGEDEDTMAPRRADTYRIRPTDWLWWPRIPKNAITILAARGGTGKGLVCADIAARITTGNYWPDSTEKAPRGNVLWCEAEDSVEETVLPRLSAAKADISKVYMADTQVFSSYDIADFIRVNNIKLIVLSPMISFLQGIEDSNAQIETRRSLEHLTSVVESSGCAILGVMHLNKKTDLSAVERILGSVEFANFPRSILLMGKEDDHIVRVVHGKWNLGPGAEDLIFKSVNRKSKSHPRGQFIGIDWSSGADKVDVNTVLERTQREAAEDESAGDWLVNALKNGEKECRELFVEAEKLGFTKSALYRARLRHGGIAARRVGKTWLWKIKR